MIGVFDSGFGGLTILKELKAALPEYDFLYLGDNARAPYGSRSFETIHRYTLEAVKVLFEKGCPLVILACNTASARALRTIQQRDLPAFAPENRVLGIIRPTTEEIGLYTKTGHIGILGTAGTIVSGSYPLEIGHFFPQIRVEQQACPLWVPLIENGEMDSPGARYFVQKYMEALLSRDSKIDTILLACTHYPLLEAEIRHFTPPGVQIISQGGIVARKTVEYLGRHPELEKRLSKTGKMRFLTTDTAEFFKKGASFFWNEPISVDSLTFI